MELKAGLYWFGDPCYQVSDEEWDEIDWMTVDLYDGEGISSSKRTFYAARTSYGDGLYPAAGMLGGKLVSDRFSVDSGLLGVVPVLPGEDVSPFGVMFESKEDFNFICYDGAFMIQSPKYNSFRVET